MGDICGDPQYDAATANWGGSWRMPTKAEIQELKDKCTWTWTTQGGHNGYKVTGKNGKSIFLPAAGHRLGTTLYLAGTGGYDWSGTPDGGLDGYAYLLSFYGDSNSVDWDWSNRHIGLSVRPVTQ